GERTRSGAARKVGRVRVARQGRTGDRGHGVRAQGGGAGTTVKQVSVAGCQFLCRWHWWRVSAKEPRRHGDAEEAVHQCPRRDALVTLVEFLRASAAPPLDHEHT